MKKKYSNFVSGQGAIISKMCRAAWRGLQDLPDAWHGEDQGAELERGGTRA